MSGFRGSFGLDRSQRLPFAQFLHRELRVRFARLIVELRSLPFGLPERRGVRRVLEWFSDYLRDLERLDTPQNEAEEEYFTHRLSDIFDEHLEVIKNMSLGVRELIQEVGVDAYDKDYAPTVDLILDRFFMARIGLRFLIQHHIESLDNRPGHSGIIESFCGARHIADNAAEDARRLAYHHLGIAPDFEIREMPADATFTYVPMHLQYMLTELFKNAARATAERHLERITELGPERVGPLPPVVVSIVYGDEDVAIKVSDEGGGIPRSEIGRIWRYMHSTYSNPPTRGSSLDLPGGFLRSPISGGLRPTMKAQTPPRPADSAANPLQRPMSRPSANALAGYGVGLSLSRLYARYFGGDLELKSLEGFGTDAFLHINRLGQNCENLPQGVHYSPAMRDSSPTERDSASSSFMD